MTLIDVEGHFRYYKRFHFAYIKDTAYIMYEVN